MQHQQFNRLKSYQSNHEVINSNHQEEIEREVVQVEDNNVLSLFDSQPSSSSPENSNLSLNTLSSSQSTTIPSTEEWTILPLFALPPTPRSTTTTTTTTRSNTNSSNNSTTSNSNSSSNNTNQIFQTELSQSLFPSHDGNGIFVMDLEDSLIMDNEISEVEGSIYASGLGLGFDSRGGGGGSNTTSESRTTEERSSASSSNHFRARRNTSQTRSSRQYPTTRRLPSHSSISPNRFSLTSPQFTNLELEELNDNDEDASSSIGSSWALTEAHLSSLPNSISKYSPQPNNNNLFQYRKMSSLNSREVIILNQFEEKAAVEGVEVIGRNWKGKEKEKDQLILERRYDELEDEDEEIKIDFLTRSRRNGSYPTPPPEISTATKRRHRESGRENGSQKRSSTSGSHQGNSNSLPLTTTSIRINELEKKRLEVERIKKLNLEKEKKIFLGRFVGSLMDVDGETLSLVASSTSNSKIEEEEEEEEESNFPNTPTQTRVNSPLPRSIIRKSTLRNHQVGAVVSRFAQQELGELDSEMFELEEEEEEGEEEESGNETETEGTLTVRRYKPRSQRPIRTKGAVSEWYQEYRPSHHQSISDSASTYSSPLFTAPNDSEVSNFNPTRSHSLSSLTQYYQYDTNNNSGTNDEISLFTSTINNNAIRRRTNSFTSGSNSGGVTREGDKNHHHHLDTSSNNAWGGEFEGLEYALSYWRRILQKMRWV